MADSWWLMVWHIIFNDFWHQNDSISKKIFFWSFLPKKVLSHPVFPINKKTTKSQNKDQKKTTISWKKDQKKTTFERKKDQTAECIPVKINLVCMKHAYGNLLGIYCLNIDHHLPTLEIQLLSHWYTKSKSKGA